MPSQFIDERPIITLTTDFGVADPYVAALKGEILRYFPQANIIDISHEVPPFNILAGTFILANASLEFPPGTIHVVIVDPEAHNHRNILIGDFGGSTYIFPDNGVISMVKRMVPLQGLVSVRDVSFMNEIGAIATRERDYFAALTAFVASGGDLTSLGITPQTFKVLDLPEPKREHGKLIGNVIYVDRVGNLVTNILAEHVTQRWARYDRLCLEINGKPVEKFTLEYFDPALTGHSFAFVNSMGLVEIEVARSSASQLFNAYPGSPVVVEENMLLPVDPDAKRLAKRKLKPKYLTTKQLR